LIIISLFFLIFRLGIAQDIIPLELVLSQNSEFKIIKKSLSDAHNFFLGTGPSTFSLNYSRFKPLEINQTDFWGLKFHSGSSEIFDKLLTSGTLGFLSLIFIFASFLWRAGKNLVSLFQEERFNKEDYGASPSRSLFDLAIFSSFLALIFSLFIYPANFTLLFYLWFLLGILSQRNQRMKDPVFFRAPLTPIIPSVLIFLSVTILSFFLIRNYLAETKYLSGLKFWQQGKLESATDKINGAISLNPDLDNYYRDISQLYLDKLEGALGDNQLSQEEKASKSQVLFREAIRLAIRATEISKENVANWNNLGFIRQSLIDLTGESEDLAIDSYKRANELEPTNPLILTKIGELYLHKAEMLLRRQKEVEATESLKEAKNNFQKAISLKADYSPAHFQLAIALIRENRVEEAIKKLEETRLLSPFDTEVAFQLGLLYYSGNQLDLAKAELERAVRLDQNYSNARYFLGLIFDKEGNKEKAIEQFEWIEKLNPENPEVKTILENLRGGKPALEEISSNQ
jgi:tetratricopeptide (TPR) repeat protein